VVRDLTSGMSRGIAFVEFHSVEYAAHVLSNSSQLQTGRNPLRINFAKDSVIASIPAYQQQQLLLMQVRGSRRMRLMMTYLTSYVVCCDVCSMACPMGLHRVRRLAPLLLLPPRPLHHTAPMPWRLCRLLSGPLLPTHRSHPPVRPQPSPLPPPEIRRTKLLFMSLWRGPQLPERQFEQSPIGL
jgi:hypothetical protein